MVSQSMWSPPKSQGKLSTQMFSFPLNDPIVTRILLVRSMVNGSLSVPRTSMAAFLSVMTPPPFLLKLILLPVLVRTKRLWRLLAPHSSAPSAKLPLSLMLRTLLSRKNPFRYRRVVGLLILTKLLLPQINLPIVATTLLLY